VLGGDLVEALANLPAPPPPDAQTTTEALAATGTDDVESVAPTFAPESDLGCQSVALSDTTDQRADTSASDRKSLEMSTVDNDCHDMAQMPVIKYRQLLTQMAPVADGIDKETTR